MSFQQITYEVDERIATITLNRPEKLNAFTSRMVHEVCGAFDLADADDDVHAVIVTGAGRAFCAGADMSAGGTTFQKTSGPWPHDGTLPVEGEEDKGTGEEQDLPPGYGGKPVQFEFEGSRTAGPESATST